MNDEELFAAGAFCGITHRFGPEIFRVLFLMEGLKRFSNQHLKKIEANAWNTKRVLALLRKFYCR
jgi:hypothetical protein